MSGPSFRERLDERPALRSAYRIGVGVAGALVLAVGVVAIPYPGPGWLIVFAGLAILATEFPWARRTLHFARGRYDAWAAWLRRQVLVVRLGVLALTGLIVAATLWLLDALYLMAGWVGLERWTWLQSPILG